MKIEINIGKEIMSPVEDGENTWWVNDIDFENYGYYDSIDKAIIALQRLKQKTEEVIRPRCDKCVYLPETCGQTDKNGKCWKYKRDPPDGGYYG